jgi:hypothetical protein
MKSEEPRIIWATMQLGGNNKQLYAMEDAGLISSQARYGGSLPQRNWYLTEDQWSAIKDYRPVE